MFTPIVAKKVTTLLSGQAEKELIMLFDDLLEQANAKIKANTSDLELRIFAIKKELLESLKNYRTHIEDAVRNGSSTSFK